jgi:plasmid stabilization system protein ParE
MSRDGKGRERLGRVTARLLWSARARRDLLEIGDYVARDRPVAAAALVRSLIESAERAAAMPLAGRVVPELGLAEVREVICRKHRVVYRVRGGEVVVLTIFNGARLLENALGAGEPE